MIWNIYQTAYCHGIQIQTCRPLFALTCEHNSPITFQSLMLFRNSLTVFELLQPQLSIDLYLPRLRSTVLPLATSDQSHCDPALWNAICLVVVSCYGPDERRLERLFLDRLHYYGFESVSTTCNLEEHIVASVLEVYYLLHVGRVSEAHNRSSSSSSPTMLSRYYILNTS